MILNYEGYNKRSYSNYNCNYHILWNHEHIVENIRNMIRRIFHTDGLSLN